MSLQMRQNFGQRMEQRLKLTPQMIQSIEILLLPQMALEERIMHEVESNPVLEVADEGGAAETAAGDAPAESGPASEPYDDTDRWLMQRKQRHNGDEDGPDKQAALEAAPNRGPTLAEHVIEQLRFVEM